MAILTLENAKAQLNITGANHDVELATFIAAASRIVEYYTGPIDAREVVEVAHPSGTTMMLSSPPVLSITSAVPIYPGGLIYDPADLDIDPTTGIVRHRLLWNLVGPLRVTYEAGRAAIPANADLAARIIVQHLWSTRRGGSRRPGMGQSDDIVEQQIVTVMGFAIPRRAVELLQPDQTLGIA